MLRAGHYKPVAGAIRGTRCTRCVEGCGAGAHATRPDPGEIFRSPSPVPRDFAFLPLLLHPHRAHATHQSTRIAPGADIQYRRNDRSARHRCRSWCTSKARRASPRRPSQSPSTTPIGPAPPWDTSTATRSSSPGRSSSAAGTSTSSTATSHSPPGCRTSSTPCSSTSTTRTSSSCKGASPRFST